MKLTEKILDYFYEEVLQGDEHYLHRFEENSESELGEKITWLMMEDQILENQNIVDELKKIHVAGSQLNTVQFDMITSDGVSLLEKIVKNSTGKDIKDL